MARRVQRVPSGISILFLPITPTSFEAELALNEHNYAPFAPLDADRHTGAAPCLRNQIATHIIPIRNHLMRRRSCANLH